MCSSGNDDGFCKINPHINGLLNKYLFITMFCSPFLERKNVYKPIIYSTCELEEQNQLFKGSSELLNI
jgi:hypothetical protein